MTTKNNLAAEPTAFRLVITRLFKAPCPLVYQAWTDPGQLVQWFSPQDGECRSISADLKIGGAFRIHIASPKGDHIGIGEYRQIVPGKLLQFTWQWEHYAMPDSLITVDFEDLGDATRLTLTHAGLPDQEDADDHQRGWTSLLEKFSTWIEHSKIN